MIKFIFKIIKRVIFAILFLYGLNLITSNLNIVIPINLITIGIVTLLELPGIGAIVALYLLI